MLDASVATATTTWSPSSSPNAPRRFGDDQTQTSKRGDRVPSSSGSSPPFLNWLAPTAASTSQRSKNSFLSARSALSSMSPPSSTNSAMAMEGEWESYTAPFFLVAAADILYHDMNHCFHRHHYEGEDSGGARMPGGDAPHAAVAEALPALSRLYLRIVDDVVRLQQILCDPLLDKPTQGDRTAAAAPAASAGLVSASVQRSADTARSLSETLELLVAVCRIRSQLVNLQCRLFASAATFVHSAADADAENDRDGAHAGQQNENENENAAPTQASQPHISPSSCLADASNAVNRILQAPPVPNIEASGDEDSTAPSGAQILYQSTIKECHKWKYCLEAACGLDRCRYVLVSMTFFVYVCLLPRCTGSTLVFTIDDLLQSIIREEKSWRFKSTCREGIIYITTIREAVDRAHILSAYLLSFVAELLRQVLRHPFEPAQLQGLPPRATQPPQEPAESVVPQHVRSHRVGAARVL
jgi:hypothetical protein